MQQSLIHHEKPIIPALHKARPWIQPGVSGVIPRVVKTRMLQPERLTISQWAEKYRRVTEIDAVPGPWRNDLVPHAVKIMDTIGQPHVREAWICAVERAAKTQIVLNTCLWTIDRSAQSGNIFWLMPTELDARKALGDRIIPVLRATERTARFLSPKQDETTRGGITFTNGLTLRPAWSNSPGSMASYFGRLNIADEVDKFPDRTSEGTDPITLFLKRSRDDRHRSKYLFVSTPAGRYIYKGMLSCEQIWEYRMRCPDCGDSIAMDIEHLIIPEGTTPETANRAEILYACNSCGSLWNEYRREIAYDSGHWTATKGAELRHPQTVGFHFPALPCPKVSFAEIAAAYLRSKSGGLQEKSAWANGYEAVDYIEDIGEAPELAALIDRCEAYAPVVPMGAALLTAGVDVQADRIEIEVVAWGIGGESWGMEYAVLYGDTRLPDVWNQLDGYLLREWEHSCGEKLRIARAFVDGGYIPNTVARFCYGKKARGVYMIKGASTHDAPEVQGPVKQKHGGYAVEVFNLGGNKLKTQMFAWFGLNEPGPGYCHIPETYPGKWFDMLQAEHAVEKKIGSRTVMVWEKKPGKSRNESIDLRQYALAALMSMRVDIKGILAGMKARVEQREKPAAQAARKSNFATGWKK